ncbi:MAG: glycosyltransferase family 2 protein [Acidobacteria bacterium]|nr:glycosyltransferase family 2 protein [Acidobacteriota bacterium]
MTISVVIPAYNESARLPETLRKIAEYAPHCPRRIVEVIVVDDGSGDETANVASSAPVALQVRTISYSRNSGKGYAVRRGVIEARGELVLISDADLSTPISEVAKLLEALETHDIAIGSRFDRALIKRRQAWLRERVGRVGNHLMRAITGMPFRDTQCGFKLLRADRAREIFRVAVIDRFAWDVELLLLAGLHGCSIAEVPVLWFNAEGSRVNVLRDAPKVLWDIGRLRLRYGSFRDVTR